MAVQWFIHVWTFGNDGKGAETLLYATRVDIDSGPRLSNPHSDPEGHLSFHERMPLEMARWQDIAEQVNLEHLAGSTSMRVIPGSLIIAAVHDEIFAASAPVLKNIEDFLLIIFSLICKRHILYIRQIFHLLIGLIRGR